MIEAIEKYIETFDENTKQRFNILFKLILESTTQEIQEKFWARIPSIYCGDNFVRLIPFKDHINICKNRSMSHSSSGECRTVIPEHVAHSNRRMPHTFQE